MKTKSDANRVGSLKTMFVVIVVLMIPISNVFAAGGGGSGGIYTSRPNEKTLKNINSIGATGLKARINTGLVVKVDGAIEGSPAAGKFKAGQIIVGVNGTPFEGNNLYVVLGNALNAAESTDGKVVFDIKDNENAPVRKVAVDIPVLGKYSDTWPLDCEKSKGIIKRAADYYATDKEFKEKYFKSRGIGGALACLFLMSTGDDQYLPVVKAYFDNFPKDVTQIGSHTWNNGYNGIACCEYYLRTGDKSVLPIIQYYCDDAKARQKFERGWKHWGMGINPRYVAGGLMNPAGSQIVSTLLLAKECGADVDDEVLNDSLRYWYRFVGHGTVPYGDHIPEGGLGSNGKDGMAAAMMQLASGAQGDTGIYQKAKKWLSMSMVTSYPCMVTGHGDNGRGDGIWRGISMAYMLDFDALQYHEVMRRIEWWYTLSRRPSGAFGMGMLDRFDDEGSGAAVALSYTAPLKTLRITGADKSKYGKSFTVPEKLWGKKADLEFLSVKNNPKYYQYGKDEPIYIPFWKFGSAYNNKIDLDSITKDEMLQNVYHRRYMIRAQAAKALRAKGDFDELEKLLGDSDPRVRRAALDGMIDYRYWFKLGKNPIKTEQFSPKMVAAIKKMLSDPDESIWVVDGALSALKFAPAKDIAACQSLIMPWTTHDDWWLRESSFLALSGLDKDPQMYPKIVPTLMKIYGAEYHTMPRERMLGYLSKSLRANKPDSPVGKMILNGMLKAAKQSTIIPGERSNEGAYNVYKVALECAKYPQAAVTIGRIVQERSDELDIEQIIGVSNELLSRVDKLSGKERERLIDILYGFRRQMVREMKAGKTDSKLMDTLIAVTKLKNPDVGWREIGQPPYHQRVWRYTTVEPKGKDVLRKTEGRRHRSITLPDELKGWYKPEFDDENWDEGKAPIGVGIYKHPRGNTVIKNNSTWTDGEFILMRTTFEMDSLKYDKYRIRILANKGFTIYLNGKQIENYGWWEKTPQYKIFDISPGHNKAFREGKNVLAVYAGAGYDPETQDVIGQIDLYIEGFDSAELE